MRQDQRARLELLTEALAEVVLEEADPKNWQGAGKPVKEMTKQERGDRVWDKRNAAATLGLLERVQRTLTDSTGAQDKTNSERPELEAEIKSYEKDAAKLLAQVQQRVAAAGRGR